MLKRTAIRSGAARSCVSAAVLIILAFTASFLGCGTGSVLWAQALPAARPPVVVNEVMASNITIVRDSQGEYNDWIELYNAGDMPIDLAGMYLTDDSDEPTMWMFPTDDPAATTIGAHGYLLVWTDEDAGGVGLRANFSLEFRVKLIAFSRRSDCLGHVGR